MDYLVSLDSSRDLQSICVKSFVNKFHLVLEISKIPSQKFFYVPSKHGLKPTRAFAGDDTVAA